MNILDELARKYNTDKRTNDFGQSMYHGYTLLYSELFEKDRENIKNILEIGVATGASHKMWHDYFPNAKIYGIDTFEEFGEPDFEGFNRIYLDKGSQEDSEFLNTVFPLVETFDIIIDDGGHTCWQHQISFKYLFPRVKNSGYYIIEDMETSFIRKFRQYDDIRSSTHAWLKSLSTDAPFSYYISEKENIRIFSEIEYISYWDQLAIIKKK